MIEEISNYLNQIRYDFTKGTLSKSSVLDNPFEQYAKWFEEAVQSQVLDPMAMVLSTISKEQMPDNRIIYNRGLTNKGILFYTNYNSKKGHDIEYNSKVATLNFWPELERQVRMRGKVIKLDEKLSDEYFSQRPFESKIGAWVSKQSTKIESRKYIENQVIYYTKKFEGNDVPRPKYWGGYYFMPTEVEFWQGRRSRLHDRILYEKQNDNKWVKNRISP